MVAQFFNILDIIFGNHPGLQFIYSDKPTEQIINVAGQNVLLIHGNQLGGSKIEASVQKVKGKYAAQGIVIDFVLLGHFHSARIGDAYARSSSIIGANAYSEDGLQLASRASQNLHILFPDGNRDSIKVDLQNISGVSGYDIETKLEEYNAKSANKLINKEVIFEVVV